MSRFHAMKNGTGVAAAVRTSHAVTRGGIRPDARAIDHRANFFAVVLAATPTSVTRSRHDLARWLQTLAVDPDQLDQILLAVIEAVTNAIEHGSRCDATERVSIRAALRDSAVTVTVKDNGRWIPVRHDSAARNHRGRGLILIRELADNVDIVCTTEGTEITMRFTLSAAQANQ
jgi:anti-sigma regulatory factor (Ser/Thr protein kinase)